MFEVIFKFGLNEFCLPTIARGEGGSGVPLGVSCIFSVPFFFLIFGWRFPCRVMKMQTAFVVFRFRWCFVASSIWQTVKCLQPTGIAERCHPDSAAFSSSIWQTVKCLQPAGIAERCHPDSVAFIRSSKFAGCFRTSNILVVFETAITLVQLSSCFLFCSKQQYGLVCTGTSYAFIAVCQNVLFEQK